MQITISVHATYMYSLVESAEEDDAVPPTPPPKKKTSKATSDKVPSPYVATSGVEQLGGKPRSLKEIKQMMSNARVLMNKCDQNKGAAPGKDVTPKATPTKTQKANTEGSYHCAFQLFSSCFSSGISIRLKKLVLCQTYLTYLLHHPFASYFILLGPYMFHFRFVTTL